MRPDAHIRTARPMTAGPGPPRKPGPPKKSVPPKPKPTPIPPSSPPRWRWLLPAGFVIAFIALLLFHPGAGGAPAQA